jgi:hypothetical protein
MRHSQKAKRRHGRACCWPNEAGRLVGRSQPTAVIAGLDPAIHDEPPRPSTVKFDAPMAFMDGRVKPGHDLDRLIATTTSEWLALPSRGTR